MALIAVEEDGKKRGGIKSRGFGGNPNNGESHRRNAAKKKAQHLKNVAIRSALYSEFQGEKGWIANSGPAKEWHSRLDAISNGTA